MIDFKLINVCFLVITKKMFKIVAKNPKQKRWHGKGSDEHLDATVMSIFKQR